MTYRVITSSYTAQRWERLMLNVLFGRGILSISGSISRRIEEG